MKRLSDKLIEQFNFRIKAELESGYLYENMSICLQKMGLPNSSKYWHKVGQDELNHAQWAIDYMNIMDVPVEIPVIVKQSCIYKSLKEIVEATLEHEYLVTKQCNELAIIAMQEKDLVTYNFIAEKYLKEQVEEIETYIEYKRLFDTLGDCVDVVIQLEANFASKI